MAIGFHEIGTGVPWGCRGFQGIVGKEQLNLEGNPVIEDNRKHLRMMTSAKLDSSVQIIPPPPYAGDPIAGKLVNISAGGMALLMDMSLKEGELHRLNMSFPDDEKIETLVQVKHIEHKDNKYIHGFEFMSVPQEMMYKIERMAQDYADCEKRIQKGAQEVCKLYCSFYPICSKKQKFDPIFDVKSELKLVFSSYEGGSKAGTKELNVL